MVQRHHIALGAALAARRLTGLPDTDAATPLSFFALTGRPHGQAG